MNLEFEKIMNFSYFRFFCNFQGGCISELSKTSFILHPLFSDHTSISHQPSNQIYLNKFKTKTKGPFKNYLTQNF